MTAIDLEGATEQQIELGRQMIGALGPLVVGCSASLVASAITRVCAALVHACAQPGEERDALLLSAEYLVNRAERLDARLKH
jgi:hypothetical protein